MSRSLLAVLAGTLLLGPAGRAHGQEADARALVEKALKAQGGLKKFQKGVASFRKYKGNFLSENFAFKGESYSEPGNRHRLVLRGTSRGVDSTRMLVLNGEQGWISYDGAAFDLDAAMLDRLTKAIYADRVCGLITLVKDKGYTLSTLGEAQVKDKPGLGVKVQSEGKPDVLLYFDKQSGLLVKSSNKVKDVSTDREVLQEIHYLDYRLRDPAAAEEEALRAAKVGTDGPALLELLRRRIPAEQEQTKIKELIIQLGHRAFSVRQKATAELQKLGLKAAGPLAHAARDPDAEVSRRARQCLAQLAEHPDVPVAAAAVRLIALRKPAGASAVLLDYFRWAPSEAVTREVQGALAAVAKQGGKRDPVLVKALKDRDPLRKAAAAAALGEDGGAYLKQPWRRVFPEPILVPMRSELHRDGTLSMTLETVEVHYFNRLDDSLFARP
jgi:hypothetical protein